MLNRNIKYPSVYPSQIEIEFSGANGQNDLNTPRKNEAKTPPVEAVKPELSVSDDGISLNDSVKVTNSEKKALSDEIADNSNDSDTLNYMDFFTSGTGSGQGGGLSGGNLKLPTFLGGDFNSFRNWFMRRFRLPFDAPAGFHERVMVSFSVDRTGTMRNIKVRACSSKEVEREILRVLNSAPKWEPGLYNGEYTGFNLQMPVNFK